jgi:hypothetical protein
MKYIPTVLIALAVFLSGCYGCGNKTSANELTGQVVKRTPLVCPDYVEVDISLGVMRNGIGSMSHEDISLRVMDESKVPELEKAAKDGAIITLIYDQARVAMCYPDHKADLVSKHHSRRCGTC